MLGQCDFVEPIRRHRKQSLRLAFDFVIVSQPIEAEHPGGKLADGGLRIVRLMQHLRAVEQRLALLLKIERIEMILHEKSEPAMQIIEREGRLGELTGPVSNLLKI